MFGRFGLWSVHGIRSNCLSYVGEECRCFHEAHLNFGADFGCFYFLLRYADRYFFGFNLYGNDIPFFNKMRDLFFLDNQWMFNLSLILGAVQIIFGMILKAANQIIQFGLKYALSTIGWIIVLVSTALAFLLGDTMPMGGTVHLVILGLAGVLIFLLNSPGKNIFSISVWVCGIPTIWQPVCWGISFRMCVCLL